MQFKVTYLVAMTIIWVFISLSSAAKEKGKLPYEKPEIEITPDVQKVPSDNQPTISPATPGVFDIPWLSINAGGDMNLNSTNFVLKASVGQSVIGSSSSSNYKIGIGFWYWIVDTTTCLAQPGDVNGIPPISLPDVVHLVNYVFDKDRPATGCLGSDPGNCWTPDPLCRGEVNGLVPIGLADVIYLVNYIFDKDRPGTGCLGSDPGNCWNPVQTEACCLEL